MANSLLTKAKEKLLRGQIDLVGAVIKAVLVKNTYTANLGSHEFLTSLDTHTIGSAVELPNRTVAGSAFDADGCIDPAVSAQVRPLMQTPQRVSSLLAPGAGAGGYKSQSSHQ